MNNSTELMDIPKIFKNPPNRIDISNLPNHGLFHSIKHLNEVKNQLYKYDIQNISNYSDYVTRYSLNELWLCNQIKENQGPRASPADGTLINYEMLTTTAIGNIAYLGLNCNDEFIKKICLKNFNEWKEFETKKNQGYAESSKCKRYILYATVSVLMIGVTYFVITKNQGYAEKR